jgi:protein-L-isoaspartate(D-aspartate) O-methyltransferase
MSKDLLIKSLIKDGYLKTPAIIDAFYKIDRIDFVPEDLKQEAYGNYPLPIGYGQTISQPLTVAFMLELLEPKVGEKILDIGSGSGWQTALLAQLVTDKGKVVAIEIIPELVKLTKENISKYNFDQIVEVIEGDGSKGYEPLAPYDKIIAAAAAQKIPPLWLNQLKIGGKIVAPVKNSIYLLEKTGPDEFLEKQYFGFSFVPLVTKE